MGLGELVLIVLAAAAGGAGFALARGRWPTSGTAGAPRSTAWMIAGLALLTAGLVAAWALGGLVLERFIAAQPAEVTVAAPRELVFARLAVSGYLSAIFSLPGGAAIAGALLGEHRSRLVGLTLGASLAVIGGFVLTGVAAAVVLPAVPLDDLAPLAVDVRSFARTLGRLLLALSLTCAIPALVAIFASRSRRAFQRALFLNLAVPAGSLLVAALLTPPDVLSQGVFALALLGAWGFGLGLAALLVRR